ncbi:MAG: DNA repair protein RecN [Saprospiraceae bacterium]|nr:DNA repair protein RecN [Saprospiraceae bacterium]MDP4997386.1 DNA repair protein RecN [Saprospiraceae bacterium]
MIKKLHIQNYAIIDELRIDFSEGLTIITGETGAGKSILIGALGLIMGNRADTKSLYNELEKSVVEAVFDIGSYDLKPFFEANELDYDSELVIRRELSPSGKSRAFINDTPVNLGVLQQLSSTLIDLHQQFDTLDIHETSFQLRVLDALAENKNLLAAYRRQYRQFESDKSRLAAMKAAQLNAAKEQDFIAFQLSELDTAALTAGEQDALEEEQLRLSNAEDIKRNLAGAYLALSESETAVVSQLEEVLHAVQAVKKFDKEIESIYQRLEAARYELDDLSRELENLSERTDYDPGRLSEIQQRLDLIYRLQAKHQVKSVEELISLQENLRSRIQAVDDRAGEIAKLEELIARQHSQLLEIAGNLSDRRKSVTADFESQVMGMLRLLSMEHARLEVAIEYLPDPGPTGFDEVNFLFAANLGSRLQAIKDVASGGEIARLTLVIKSLVASAIPLPTLIFDEIDTGISGGVALKMGQILRALSDQHQVVAITHSPQVASKADAHYFVYKEVIGNRTATNVKQLDMEGRIQSIAVMLSQYPPTESALKNAKELLELT